MRIALYSRHIQKVSGIQTFERVFCKKLCKYFEIIYIYDVADSGSLDEVSKYVEVVKNQNQRIEVDICIYSASRRGTERIVAKKYIQICHSNFAKWRPTYSGKGVDIHIAVSETVQKIMKESFGKDSVVIPNMLDEDVRIEKVLRLMTASRIQEGKGFERVVQLAKKLKEANRKFIWEIYGSGNFGYIAKLKRDLEIIQEVCFMGEKKNMQSYMAINDYIIQLSDNEGFCYSIYEALQIGKPVIVTNWEGVSNVVENKKNGYILDMDLGNLNINEIYDSIPTVQPLQQEDISQKWVEVLTNL